MEETVVVPDESERARVIVCGSPDQFVKATSGSVTGVVESCELVREPTSSDSEAPSPLPSEEEVRLIAACSCQ
jgi:hypothetical protein